MSRCSCRRPGANEHDRYLAEYQRTGTSHIIGIGREVEGQRKDGQIFAVDLAVSEIDHLGLFTGTLRDISQRKLLEREVIEIASMEQERIGQDLHDQCGQELTALGLMADGLAESLRQSDPEAAHVASAIEQGLRSVLRQLRNISRRLALTDVSPSELNGALDELASRLKSASVSCTFQVEGPVKLDDRVQSTQLFHIAQEACTNAIKHSQAKSVRIRLRSAHGVMMLEIQDDGVGIAKDSRQGLGMPSCAIAPTQSAPRSRLDPRSRAGPWSPARSRSCTMPASGSKTAPRSKVLIVDDHPAVREAFAGRVSQLADFQICGEAADVPAAVQLIQETKPDVIVVDITLKHGNGLDLIKRVKARSPEARILVWSMHGEEVYAERQRCAGAMGYITKEQAMSGLIQAMRQVAAGKVYLSARCPRNCCTGLSEPRRDLSIGLLSKRCLIASWKSFGSLVNT